MNFKSSIHIIFSLVVFCCFADREIVYQPEGLSTITKMVLYKEKNISKQLFFLKGLHCFCKEQGIQQRDVIGKTRKIYGYEGNPRDYYTNTNLEFKHPTFPQNAALTIYKEKRHTIVLKRSFEMTPEMEKFVQDMIEKGKSVNQNN